MAAPGAPGTLILHAGKQYRAPLRKFWFYRARRLTARLRLLIKSRFGLMVVLFDENTDTRAYAATITADRLLYFIYKLA